jgi:hypothetical protein
MENKDQLGKKVLYLLPIDGSEMRAKEIYEKGEANGITHITIQRKLDSLAKNKSLKRRIANHKEVYYSRQENDRIENLTESFFSEIKSTLEEIPVEAKTTRKGLLDFASDFLKGANLSENLKKQIVGDIETSSIGRITYFLLLGRVFEIIKMVEPELNNEDFYVDSEGSIVPKDLVDERISYDERSEWLAKAYGKHTK